MFEAQSAPIIGVSGKDRKVYKPVSLLFILELNGNSCDIQNIENVILVFINELYWSKSMFIYLHIVNKYSHAMVVELSPYPENPGIYLLSNPLRKRFENSIFNLGYTWESIMVVLVAQDNKNTMRKSCTDMKLGHPHIVKINI